MERALSRKRKRIERRERDSNDRGLEPKAGDENNGSFTREMHFTRRLSVFHGRSAAITSSAHITLTCPAAHFNHADTNVICPTLGIRVHEVISSLSTRVSY